MKLLIRIMGLMVISIIVIVTLIYLINISIIINELNNVSVISINQTQKAHINNPFKTNDEYKNYFIDAFKNSVKDENIYDIEVETDKDKGLIYTSINCNKYMFVKTKKLLNIIEKRRGYYKPIEYSAWQNTIPDSEYVKIDYSGVNKLNITSNSKWNSYLKSKTFPQELYYYEFDEAVKLKDYNIKIYAYISTAKDITSSYWYPGISLEVQDENGNWIIVDSKTHNNYNGTQLLKGTSDLKVKAIRLILNSLNINNGYETKINKLASKSSYINYYGPRYAYVTKWSEELYEDYKEGEIVKEGYYDIASRYIGNIDTLKSNSIWLINKEYLNILKEYIKKYEEIN